jgi:cell division protein FtsB
MPPDAQIRIQQQESKRAAGVEPLRRKRIATPSPRPWRKGLNVLLLFVTVVLVVDALIGENGFMDTLRVRRQSRELQRSVAALKAENARLLEHARRLKDDPLTIESIARRELGLIREGEILFILKDVKPPQK